MSNDNLPDLKIIRTRCQDFAKLHLTACCAELLEWQDTAILCDGRVRELAALCNTFVGNHDGLRVAESFINLAAVEAQRDAVAASGAGVPAGYVLVPTTPTHAMCEAAHSGPNCAEHDMRSSDREFWEACYAAMIAAAPTHDSATKAEAAAPADPMGWPLPCEVQVGPGKHRQGTKLRTLVTRMQQMHKSLVTPNYCAACRKDILATEAPKPDQVRDADTVHAWFARKSEFGPWLECSPSTAGARLFTTAKAAAPVEAVTDWPEEPTPEMQHAGASAIRFDTTLVNKLWTANAVYRAMRAAIQAQAGEGGKA